MKRQRTDTVVDTGLAGYDGLIDDTWTLISHMLGARDRLSLKLSCRASALRDRAFSIPMPAKMVQAALFNYRIRRAMQAFQRQELHRLEIVLFRRPDPRLILIVKPPGRKETCALDYDDAQYAWTVHRPTDETLPAVPIYPVPPLRVWDMARIGDYMHEQDESVPRRWSSRNWWQSYHLHTANWHMERLLHWLPHEASDRQLMKTFCDKAQDLETTVCYYFRCLCPMGRLANVWPPQPLATGPVGKASVDHLQALAKAPRDIDQALRKVPMHETLPCRQCNVNRRLMIHATLFGDELHCMADEVLRLLDRHMADYQERLDEHQRMLHIDRLHRLLAAEGVGEGERYDAIYGEDERLRESLEIPDDEVRTLGRRLVRKDMT